MLERQAAFLCDCWETEIAQLSNLTVKTLLHDSGKCPTTGPTRLYKF